MQMQHTQNRWHLDGGEHRPLTDFAPPVPAIHPAPVPETACRRTYDHRLRELAYHAGDPGCCPTPGSAAFNGKELDAAGYAGGGHSGCPRL